MKTDDAIEQLRILVVDDHEQFRRFICSTLHQRENLHVIAEVDDGKQAVRQAEALKPDLILLDVGLPGLNGIDAARQIADLVPNAKIIFVTQESSDDVVREAFAIGAWGYVLKLRAGQELLIAVESVVQGKKYACSGVDGPGNNGARGRQFPEDGA